MMHDNHVHNLLEQLVTEQKSLWRIKEMYKNDAGDCPDCQELWQKMEADKESHVADITEILKKHL